MKTLKLIIASMLIPAAFFAQNTFLNKNVSLKLYTNFLNYYTHVPIKLPILSGAIDIPTVRGNFHEIELSKLSLFNDGSNYKYHIAMRYEYNFVFHKAFDNKIIPSVGVGAQLFYARTNLQKQLAITNPDVAYLANTLTFGGFVEVTPRITYAAGKKFLFDINMPISIIGTPNSDENYFYPNEVYLPLTDVSQLKNAISIRFGVTYKLGKNK